MVSNDQTVPIKYVLWRNENIQRSDRARLCRSLHLVVEDLVTDVHEVATCKYEAHVTCRAGCEVCQHMTVIGKAFRL